jgi:hypothetical protein
MLEEDSAISPTVAEIIAVVAFLPPACEESRCHVDRDKQHFSNFFRAIKKPAFGPATGRVFFTSVNDSSRVYP